MCMACTGVGRGGAGLRIAVFAFVYQPLLTWCSSSAHTVLLLTGTGVTNTDVCSAGQWDKTDGETLREGKSLLHSWQRAHRRCCLQAL